MIQKFHEDIHHFCKKVEGEIYARLKLSLPR